MAIVSNNVDMAEPFRKPDSSDAASSETSDRNDFFGSSPSRIRDVDPQSSAALRSEEYRQLFRLPVEEVLIQDFNCAIQESILLQGHMYMFLHHICFYSNIFGFETKKIIPLHEVTCVRKAKTAGIFHNAIEIFAADKKYFFASFLSRDEAFKLLNDELLQHRTFAESVTDPQELRFDSQGNSAIDIKRMNRSDFSVHEFNSIERTEETSVPEDPKLAASIENVVVLNSLSKDQDIVEGIPEAVSQCDASSSFRKFLWKPEDFDAPKVPESYTKVAESKFMIGVEEFFTLFFSDGAVNFFESYHRRCGDKDVRCSLWKSHETLGHARNVSFRHPIKVYFGAKFGSCEEAQKFRVYRNSYLSIETSQEVSDAPYGDYFRVQGRWDVERDCDETVESCILRIHVNVAFYKKTLWKGKIEQATAEECREACSIWINIAHELLKQRNIGKKGISAANMIKNGENEIEIQRKSEESDERMHPVAVPNFSDADDSKGNLNSVRETSFALLMRELGSRLASSLKKRSKFSLLLLLFFALVFLLMQVSIMVLLLRPQQVHVISHSDHIKITSSLLQKQICGLKDELLMAEALVEKIKYHHVMLKTRIEELSE